MTLNSLFAPRQPVASSHLPLTIMLLNDWQLVNVTVLYLAQPDDRYLVITSTSMAEALVEKLQGSAQFNDSQQWVELDIEAGQPVIDVENSGQLIPQATNLQALNGICFKKGCYTGQEMVARAKHCTHCNPA